MGQDAFYLYKNKTKSEEFIRTELSITYDTTKYLREKGFYNALNEEKSEKDLTLSFDDEVVHFKIRIIDLIQNNNRERLMEILDSYIINKLNNYDNKGQSSKEIGDFKRLLFDLLNLYYTIKDNKSYIYFSLGEGEPID